MLHAFQIHPVTIEGEPAGASGQEIRDAHRGGHLGMRL
jgi:hypothetical protein